MAQLEEMQNFVRIVEAGSITRAADQLGIAKSGVSRRLVDLEQRLGVRLLNRTTRRSSLTEAGQRYYRRAARILSEVEELDADTSNVEASLMGTLRLAAPLSFGLAHLTPAIDEFLTRNDQVDIHIEFSDRKADLVRQGLDLAIRIADLSDSTLQARRICPVRILLCASPSYLDRTGRPQTPDDLAGHRLLQYDVGAGSMVRLSGPDGKERVMQTQPRISANNGDFLRDMAICGHGIIVTPSFIAWEAIASGELEVILQDYCPPQLSAYAVYPQNRFLPRRARAFIDFLVEKYGENPYWDQFSSV